MPQIRAEGTAGPSGLGRGHGPLLPDHVGGVLPPGSLCGVPDGMGRVGRPGSVAAGGVAPLRRPVGRRGPCPRCEGWKWGWCGGCDGGGGSVTVCPHGPTVAPLPEEEGGRLPAPQPTAVRRGGNTPHGPMHQATAGCGGARGTRLLPPQPRAAGGVGARLPRGGGTPSRKLEGARRSRQRPALRRRISGGGRPQPGGDPSPAGRCLPVGQPRHLPL